MPDSISISEVKISSRQRKELMTDEYAQHISDLASSIERFGLLQPVVINQDNELIAGFSRIQAHLRLGRTEIPFCRVESLNSIELKEMELEENIRRKNLSWFEEAAAIAEIHSLKQAKDPEWNMTKTAEAVGKSLGTVSQSVSLVREALLNPSIKEEKGLVSALNKVKYRKSIEDRQRKVDLQSKGLMPTVPAEILVGPAEELILREEDESYDAILTNFPFGIDLEYKSGLRPYEDEEGYIIRVVQTVIKESYRILKPDSWMVAFFDMRKITYSNAQMELYKEIKPISGQLSSRIPQLLFDSMGLAFWLKQAGFDYVQLMPNVWAKPNKTQGMIGDPNKGLLSAYEAFILAGKGNPVLFRRGLQNIFLYDTPLASERVHPVQMPTDLCSDLTSMVCLGGSRILDPFAGSGAFGLGALENQCSFRGFELDPEKASLGNMRLKEHIFAGSEDEDSGD